MDSRTIIFILINKLIQCNAVYLGEQANFFKPKLERNNILNKGVWMKDRIEKTNYGDFIFRADSGDVDNLLQNNFDAFGENYMDTIPIFSSYVERNKRSTSHKQNQRLRKSLKKCKDKINCKKPDVDIKPLFKSKFISQLRPASVFNDYPYEVAVLLANSNKREINSNDNVKTVIDPIIEIDKVIEENVKEIKLNKTKETEFETLDDKFRISNNSTYNTIPKRRMTQLQLESEVTAKPYNKTSSKTKHIDGNKINRNVFDKEETIWQSAPIHNMVLPRPESSVKNKPVTEKGLVKVLSLLTKTFKKVMKQHIEIQEIDNKLHSLNEDFLKNVAILDTKFQEFESKYTYIIRVIEDLQRLKEKFINKTDDLELSETHMSKNLKEFENQQKKFLAQQHQFYTIQKFMLEQNEKINRKQSLIAKTQSEISHRQNHFARVLKKAKQFYMDNKFLAGSKLKSILNKPTNISTENINDYKKVTVITTPATDTTTVSDTDSVKINLFSIPKVGPLLNHDKLILKEKNDLPVDDLVYKYYFNNTFIDRLMKSNVLTAVIDDEGKNTRNTKNKRDDLNNETTILLPVGNPSESPIVNNNLHRERRWIRHRNKVSKKFHNIDGIIKSKNDPFLSMATNFCIEIGQNHDAQMLNWCVKKSLRRLKSIDMILPNKPLASPPVENTPEKFVFLREKAIISGPDTTKLFPLETFTQTAESVYPSDLPIISSPEVKSTFENTLLTEKTPDSFFPDNDELEANLKQYELKPDPEGTVYFDGSLHTSDIVISGSDALSDIMPGLDSNSHVDVDPLAIDLQARRRAYVRRLNENILKMNS